MAGKELLTDRGIRAALTEARTAGKARTLNDGGGLRLVARPDGAALWRFRYWLAGKEGLCGLGTYPDTGLALARDKADELRRLVAAGTDPAEHRKGERAQRAQQAEAQARAKRGEPMPGTFEAVAREWLRTIHQPAVSEAHADRTLVRFQNDAFPYLGARMLGDIEPPELLAVLRRVVDRGAIETAHRLKHACGQVFRYGVAAGLCKRNPAADLREALPPVQTRHHAAITDPKKAGELLRAMAGYHGHPITRAALGLSVLLMLRPGELRQCEWAWVDLEAATLTIPGALMKRRKADKENGPPHVVPLAPQAVAILRELQPLTGDGRYCFPSLQTADRPMSENTVRSALLRLGFDSTEQTAHGFRAMARTMAAERLGIEPEVLEAQLAHAVPDALGRAYNRTQFLDQRRALMGKWADYVDRLRRGGDVVPLPQRAA